MIERLRPTCYLGEAGLYEGVQDIDRDLLAPEARFVLGLDASQPSARPRADLARSDIGAASMDRLAVDSDAPAALLPTSGTTGPSRLVIWTQRILASFAAGAPDRGMAARDVLLLSMPMMHGSGTWAFVQCLVTGAVAVLLPTFDADAVLDAIAKHRCTTFWSLPYACGSLVQRQRAEPRDVGSLRFCGSGGDVCGAETEQAVAETFSPPLLSTWAATEDGCAMVPAAKVGPFTRPLASAEVRLVDPDGHPVADGAEGELLVRSPGTTPGYWLGPDRMEALPDGLFHSGDQMRRESDGHLRYQGRLKDLIVRAGSNFSPVEVEDVLRRQPGIVDVAVVGLPDAELGERVGAAVVVEPGAGPSAGSDAVTAARQRLADHKLPERVLVGDAIPRNALNKVDRRAVAERFREEAAS